MMELMKLSYHDIMNMPYYFFEDTMNWKAELEKEKTKKMEEHVRETKSKQRSKK